MKSCVYRGLELYFKLPFARFVDSLLLRLASKTEMKCNSYNARNAISNVKKIFRVLFFCKTLQICIGTLLRTHICRVGFPLCVIFSASYFVPSFPESNYFLFY